MIQPGTICNWNDEGSAVSVRVLRGPTVPEYRLPGNVEARGTTEVYEVECVDSGVKLVVPAEDLEPITKGNP